MHTQIVGWRRGCAALTVTALRDLRDGTLTQHEHLSVCFKAGSISGQRSSVVRVHACKAMGESAIPVRRMDELTEDDAREIENIHTRWIKFEVAGEGRSLMALCADDIELWPPDAKPLLGRAVVSERLAHGTTRIHGIEITDRRVRGSNQIAYLTASYQTTFSSTEDSTPRLAIGSHLWILEKRAGTWAITLVSWSLWSGTAALSGIVRRSVPQH
jgi:ketosteroid isomerase-like protein